MLTCTFKTDGENTRLSGANLLHIKFSRALALVLLIALCSSNAYANSLSFGLFDQGVYSGTPPFNTTGTCTDAGDDCADTDLRIRSADIISFAWSIAASGIPAGNPAFDSVILEQTLHPGANADIKFDEIPTICLAPPQGPGGTNPPSSITVNADGSQTLLCNLGSLGNGEQTSFSVPVRPLATSFDAATFTTSQFVYALDAAGNQIVLDTAYNDSNTYSISAAPAWDLSGDMRPIFRESLVTRDMGTGRGPEQGFLLFMVAGLAADADRAGKGVSSLTNSFSWDVNLDATASDGVTPYPFEFEVTECIPNPSAWANSVFGNELVAASEPLEEHVVDSGTCVISGSPTTGWQLTSTGTDTTGSRYPTQRINNSSLAAGPYYSMAHRVQLFVPLSEIERENPANSSGAINVTSCMDNFDPDDHVGVSNYGSAIEPGAGGLAMPDGSASNNCTGPLTLEINASGNFTQRVQSGSDNFGSLGSTFYQPFLSAFHAGDGTVEPGLSYVHLGRVINDGSVPQNNFEMCFAFDNTTQRLADRGTIGATAGTYAYSFGFSGVTNADWVVEYATASFPDDDPLDGDGDGVADFNPTTGRFEGNWSGVSAINCDAPSLVWDSDPLNVGIDDVNMVRLRAISPTTTFNPGENIRLLTPLEARDTFYGGPYDGQPKPAGVVMAGFGSYRSDEVNSTWLAQTYNPSPENTSTRGDRMTFTRVNIDVAKSTESPLAAAGTAISTLAGNSVVWRLEPTVSSLLATGGTAQNMVATDILPPELTYDHTCTLATPGGTPPTQVLYNTPSAGETTLKWSLGTVVSTAAVSPLIFCTQTDAVSPAGTAVVNVATVSADNAVLSNLAAQTITLGQAGSIQASATVDVPSDLTNDQQVHTLRWYNFSGAGDVAPPTIVNVFAHGGDGASLADRSPPSVFNGSLALTGEPLVTFSDGSVPVAGDPFADIGHGY